MGLQRVILTVTASTMLASGPSDIALTREKTIYFSVDQGALGHWFRLPHKRKSKCPAKQAAITYKDFPELFPEEFPLKDDTWEAFSSSKTISIRIAVSRPTPKGSS